MLLSLASIAAAQESPIQVGSKSFTESVILGDMLQQIVESTGRTAEHQRELGGTRLLWNALLAGELDA